MNEDNPIKLLVDNGPLMDKILNSGHPKALEIYGFFLNIIPKNYCRYDIQSDATSIITLCKWHSTPYPRELSDIYNGRGL